jgi:hypothetical protein
MTTFDDRKDKFERKFVHDEARRFKATARRNKLVGQWAAGILGLSGAKADEYVRAVIAADLKEKGDEDVVRKLRADFDAAGVDQSDHQIRRHLDEFMAEAVRQVQEKG